jgi:hypothetical protein
MEPARWQRIEQLYQAALERAPGERIAFLRHADDDDEELCREVESLLEQTSCGPLEHPPWQIFNQEPSAAERYLSVPFQKLTNASRNRLLTRAAPMEHRTTRSRCKRRCRCSHLHYANH